MNNYQIILSKGTLDDALFRGRNKNYGAFELRRNYQNHLKKSFGYFILLIALFSTMGIVIPKLISKPTQIATYDKPTIFQPYHPEQSVTKPASSPPAKSRTTPENAPPEIVDQPIVKNETIQPTTTNNPISTNQNGAGTIDQSGLNPTIAPTTETSKSIEEATEFPEIYPEFPGGEKKMMDYLQTRIHFPHYLDDGTLEGKVYIEFIVNVDGSLSNFKLVQSLHPELDKISMNAVKSMPNWTPGQSGNHNVRVVMSLPISFE